MRLENGGYRRDHLHALAQRAEVADDEVRIMGSKSELLRTLVAASSVQSAVFGVYTSTVKWRTTRDSNSATIHTGDVRFWETIWTVQMTEMRTQHCQCIVRVPRFETH